MGSLLSFDAGIGGAKLTVSFCVMFDAVFLPRGDFLYQRFLVRDTPVKTSTA
jgi:hypothetical protein